MVDPSINVPTASSKSEVWIQWHKDLKKVFDKKTANSVFVFAWDKRGGIDSPANNNMLNSYVESQGFDITRGSFAQAKEDVFDFVGNIFSIGMWIGIAILGFAGIILIAILKSLTRNPTDASKLALMTSPQGRLIAGASALNKS